MIFSFYSEGSRDMQKFKLNHFPRIIWQGVGLRSNRLKPRAFLRCHAVPLNITHSFIPPLSCRPLYSPMPWIPLISVPGLSIFLMVFRHGDRSPIETFPNDPIKESSWPQGFGQLTQLGMEQHYELGQYIRKRYEKFLNKSYKHEQVFVRSTDIDRALMSAMTNLAALFPPEGISVWNPSLPWQPIPVHTVPVSEDRDFIEILPKFTGYHDQDLFGIWSKVYDPLFCEGVHNFTLPSWATEDTMTKLKEISELSLLSLYGIHRQKEKSRLQGGVLVKEILYHMKSATQPLNHRKLIIYSAHDTTVSALQMALDVYNGILPPHASCHLTELYFDKGEYFIEMYYRNETQHEPHPLTLPGCTPSCPLTKFAELVAPVISQDWSTECAMSNHEGTEDAMD
ncbi:prostatic acid phosphatase isoform X3 [Orcinus orca]|uniref:prostatic acid phosphatase isoform X3 n=1 Tax=Orcinus orca TaxID=9733 RepID=UPI00211201FB|nr:prostatic acid phosphatase isoform X3 [Orcinus orca]